jgi:hypothetical protein
MLTIGYGDGGGLPHQYFLRDGQDMDVGFLKLFLSTRSIDLRAVAQPSPFEMPSNFGLNRDVRQLPVATWDTVTIATVQRKPRLKIVEEAPV